MTSQVWSYGKLGNLFCGVEHTSLAKQEKLNVLTLRKKKGEFLIENSFDGKSIVELKTQLKKSQHLFLIINNDKILSKVLNGSFDTNKAIAQAFPNLKIEDFYVEVYTSSNSTFISICRKDYIDNLIDEYTSNQLNVMGFSLGNLVITQLTTILRDKIVETSNSSISIVDQKVTDITPLNIVESGTYDINGLQITKDYVLPLAGVLCYYTNKNTTSTNFSFVTQNLCNSFKQKRIFDLGLKFGLSFIFFSLLVSFIFFGSYTSKTNDITSALELNKASKNSLIGLSEEVNKKERLINDFSLTSSKTSWYLDQIGISLPISISLSELQFQPLLKSIKKDKNIVILENIILVKGTSDVNSEFSIWLNELELKDWVQKVTIQEYGTGKKTSTEFKLLIEIME